MPGVYTVTVHAHGYKSKTMVISVRRHRPSRVNFVLKRSTDIPGELEEEGYLIGGVRAALRQFGILGECETLMKNRDFLPQGNRDDIRAFP